MSGLASRIAHAELLLARGKDSPRVELGRADAEQLAWLEEIASLPTPPRTSAVQAQLNARGLSWMLRMPSREQVVAEICTRSLKEFLRRGWSALEPSTPLTWNWHLDSLCDLVQELLTEWRRARAEQRPHLWQNVLVNVPPGTMKSRALCVYAPAWMWLHCPDWRVTYISTNPRVALRDSDFCRRLIESPWYTQTFAPAWRLGPTQGKLNKIKDWEMAKDQNAKSLFRNTRGGQRLAIGAKARITGDRSDALFVDDPNDAKLSQSRAERDAVNEWWDAAAKSRVNDLRLSVRVIIQQRVHQDDLSGHLLANAETAKQWNRLSLPAEYDPKQAESNLTALGRSLDPRTVEGELLFPERLPREVLDAEKVGMGSAAYEAQYNQRPKPPGGLLFSPKWWRFWRRSWQPEPRDEDIRARTIVLPDLLDDLEQLQSWDFAVKDTSGADFAVGEVWGHKGTRYFLLDQVRDRMALPACIEAVRNLTLRWPRATAKLVEDKANGPNVIRMLEGQISGLVPITPEDSKEQRATAIAPLIEAGDVLIPLPENAPWVKDYLEEFGCFPKGAHDDQVDTTSQALARMALTPKVWVV
jgi:predicted phage terminase large subunit-like protein